MAGIAKLFDENVLDKSNKKVNFNDDKYKGKIIGLYFSAHWCPPCRRFTPRLIEFYNNYANEKNFEIIFLSSDRDEESFNEYYKDMPWLTFDYNERHKLRGIKKTGKFDIDGIPTLVLLDGDSGDIICSNARNKIQYKDKTGKNFPWNNEKIKADKSCILL